MSDIVVIVFVNTCQILLELDCLLFRKMLLSARAFPFLLLREDELLFLLLFVVCSRRSSSYHPKAASTAVALSRHMEDI